MDKYEMAKRFISSNSSALQRRRVQPTNTLPHEDGPVPRLAVEVVGVDSFYVVVFGLLRDGDTIDVAVAAPLLRRAPPFRGFISVIVAGLEV